MAWVTIRKATEEDYDILEERAGQFLERHGLERTEWHTTYVDAVECHICVSNNPFYDYGTATREGIMYLRCLWHRIVRRALNHPWAEGIAWDCVGYHCD